MEDKMSVLRGLQTQRNDIAAKLKRIEEKRSSVSAEVYEKVRREYAEKLKSLDNELSGHIDLLTEEIQRLKAQEERIVQTKTETKFKLEEFELRYSIGEYDEGSFKRAKREGEARMNQLDAELRRVQESIESYSALMKGRSSEPPAPEPRPEPRKEPVHEESELMIDEHILEEKLPEEEVALDELLTDDDAFKGGTAEPAPQDDTVAEEKGVACPKCGHMNTPDSWYCEKCGAEILGASGS